MSSGSFLDDIMNSLNKLHSSQAFLGNRDLFAEERRLRGDSFAAPAPGAQPYAPLPGPRDAGMFAPSPGLMPPPPRPQSSQPSQPSQPSQSSLSSSQLDAKGGACNPPNLSATGSSCSSCSCSSCSSCASSSSPSPFASAVKARAPSLDGLDGLLDAAFSRVPADCAATDGAHTSHGGHGGHGGGPSSLAKAAGTHPSHCGALCKYCGENAVEVVDGVHICTSCGGDNGSRQVSRDRNGNGDRDEDKTVRGDAPRVEAQSFVAPVSSQQQRREKLRNAVAEHTTKPGPRNLRLAATLANGQSATELGQRLREQEQSGQRNHKAHDRVQRAVKSLIYPTQGRCVCTLSEDMKQNVLVAAEQLSMRIEQHQDACTCRPIAYGEARPECSLDLSTAPATLLAIVCTQHVVNCALDQARRNAGGDPRTLQMLQLAKQSLDHDEKTNYSTTSVPRELTHEGVRTLLHPVTGEQSARTPCAPVITGGGAAAETGLADDAVSVASDSLTSASLKASTAAAAAASAIAGRSAASGRPRARRRFPGRATLSSSSLSIGAYRDPRCGASESGDGSQYDDTASHCSDQSSLCNGQCTPTRGSPAPSVSLAGMALDSPGIARSPLVGGACGTFAPIETPTSPPGPLATKQRCSTALAQLCTEYTVPVPRRSEAVRLLNSVFECIEPSDPIRAMPERGIAAAVLCVVHGRTDPAGGDPAGSPSKRPRFAIPLSAADLDEASMSRLVERLARVARK